MGSLWIDHGRFRDETVDPLGDFALEWLERALASAQRLHGPDQWILAGHNPLHVLGIAAEVFSQEP